MGYPVHRWGDSLVIARCERVDSRQANIKIPFPSLFWPCQQRFGYANYWPSEEVLSEKVDFPIALASVLLPMVAVGQSVFDGTWKLDVTKFGVPKEPDIYLLQNGMYSRKTCVAAYTVRADGTDQSVSGGPYFDSVAVKVVSANQLEQTDKKDGKVVSTGTAIVSQDGNTIRYEFSDSSNTNGGPPVTGKGEQTRVAKGAAGSHAISGSWRTTKNENVSGKRHIHVDPRFNSSSARIVVEQRHCSVQPPTEQDSSRKKHIALLEQYCARPKGSAGRCALRQLHSTQ